MAPVNQRQMTWPSPGRRRVDQASPDMPDLRARSPAPRPPAGGMSAGTVAIVEEVTAGSELDSDAAVAATTITVVDPTEFSGDGGNILIADSKQVDYLIVDDVTAGTTLAAPLFPRSSRGCRSAQP